MLLPLLLIPVLYYRDDPPAAEAAEAVAADAGRIKTGDRVTTAGGIRGIILSIKDDVDRDPGGAGRHQAGSGQERDCLGDHGQVRQ